MGLRGNTELCNYIVPSKFRVHSKCSAIVISVAAEPGVGLPAFRSPLWKEYVRTFSTAHTLSMLHLLPCEVTKIMIAHFTRLV